MDEKLAPFAELLGQIGDDEIANLAEVPVEDVAAAREAAGLPAYSEPAPEPDPAPSAPEESEPKPRKGKGKGAAKAVKAVAEAVLTVAPLVINLMRTVRYTVAHPRTGKRMSVALPGPCIYRGAMAHKVMELCGEEHRDAIEIVS